MLVRLGWAVNVPDGEGGCPRTHDQDGGNDERVHGGHYRIAPYQAVACSESWTGRFMLGLYGNAKSQQNHFSRFISEWIRR